MVTFLSMDDTGTQPMRDGVQSLREVKTKHGRVLTRRLREAFAL